MIKPLLEIKTAFAWHKLPAGIQAYDSPSNQLAFTMLEQSQEQGVPRDQDFDSDLLRVEHKLNLVIQLMSQLLSQQNSRPDPVDLKLGADFIAWRDTDAQVNDHFEIKLYLTQAISIPIQCTVKVEAVENDWCQANFIGLSQDELSAWERWVFRQHRRTIAEKREHLQ